MNTHTKAWKITVRIIGTIGTIASVLAICSAAPAQDAQKDANAAKDTPAPAAAVSPTAQSPAKTPAQLAADQKRKDENKALLELYKGLRVCDVRDAMDWIGYFGFGSMEPSVRPVWRTRVVGIARTARYLPYTGPYPTEKGDDYTDWVEWYYQNVCQYPWDKEIEDGDICCIDVSGCNSGLIGSENSLRCLAKGNRGFIFNGAGIRDTDEVIMEKIPVWATYTSQAMVQARIQFDAKDVPVAIGGVTIYPGDVVVGDGDGVIVVPRKLATIVAKWAKLILNKDKDDRKRNYQALKKELDPTVIRDARSERLK